MLPTSSISLLCSVEAIGPALAEHSRETTSTITSVKIFTFISALPSVSLPVAS